MKFYEIIIKPESGFGTPLKGDTIFGHFCWQAAHKAEILNGGLDRWIKVYEKKPFIIFSSAVPKIGIDNKFYYALKRPDLPLKWLFQSAVKDKKELLKTRKDNQKKKWLRVSDNFQITFAEDSFLTDEELLNLAFKELTAETKKMMRGKDKRKVLAPFSQPHNTINRLTSTTGEGVFAPYTQAAGFYYPEVELAIFILIDESATDIERVQSAMELIGKTGYGKDASTGWGKFSLAESNEMEFPMNDNANACYALAPVIPEDNLFKEFWFTPFTRFGRHGDCLAVSKNPFKNPVIMADEGGVFIPADKKVFDKQYIGRAATNVSKVMPEAVIQGYSPYVPFTLER